MPFISSIRGSFGPQSKGRRNGIKSMISSTGSTVTTVGSYRVHTFTTVGSATFSNDNFGALDVEILMVGGGGGAQSYSGGGGAGATNNGTGGVGTANTGGGGGGAGGSGGIGSAGGSGIVILRVNYL